MAQTTCPVSSAWTESPTGSLLAPWPVSAGSYPGHPATLTVEVLDRLPPQRLQRHLGVRPLQDQPPAVQVGAVTQGVEGSLGEQGRKRKYSALAKT